MRSKLANAALAFVATAWLTAFCWAAGIAGCLAYLIGLVH